LSGFFSVKNVGFGSLEIIACALPLITSWKAIASSSNWRAVAFGNFSSTSLHDAVPRRQAKVTLALL
jgi:hypothetical protein